MSFGFCSVVANPLINPMIALSVLVALSGTPGTGKTSAAELLRSRGYRVHGVAELAERLDVARPSNDGELEVDIERLVSGMHQMKIEGVVMVEGHFAHLLAPDLCIVLRCSPSELETRLRKREYPGEKLWNNIEAEAIAIILIEAIEHCAEVREIDTTKLTPAEVADRVEEILRGANGYLPGGVDWSGEVLSWY